MNASEMITRARTRLVVSQPFFGVLALRMKYVEDDSIPTACTDGRCIRYNPAFMLAQGLIKATGIIAHEVMHPALLHLTRQGARDAERWNMACDYAINPIILAAGFMLPDGCLNNPAFDGMSAEEIYDKLPQDAGQGFVGFGDFTPPTKEDGSALSASEVSAEEAEWKIALSQAAHTAKQQGKMPGGLERFIDDTLATQHNWRQELQQFCNTPTPGDTSWSRPNRRFIQHGLYLPSTVPEVTGTFVVCIDTSGSIGERELNLFGAEIRGIVDQLKPQEVIVIYCDARVNRVDRFETHDEITLYAVGGGGTDFRPPFAWLETENIVPDALVYLTDGHGPFPTEDEVQFPTLWAINNNSVSPPWGAHIIIEN